jgi:hypothetical protein
MKTARNLDIAIVVSGDGDFAPAIRAVQEQGVRVEVISFRGNTSSDLIEVADQFTDITQLAKVEKGSSRSGRRVAEADEDLSMTEVPDKQTEGSGAGRGRGRGGRGRGRAGEAEPVAPRPARGGRPAAAVTSGGTPLVVLPGEKLSRVAPGDPSDELDEEAPIEVVDAADAVNGTGEIDSETETDAEGRRRRRRRGGRGRGRGRGREGAEGALPPTPPTGEVEVEEEDEAYEAPRPPRSTPFGSVWDSQLGMPSAAPAASTGGLAPVGDDDDFDEPEIPEYLIAERRNRGRGQGAPGGRGGAGRGGPRGGRSAYAAAMDRERFGRGGGGGINRYPDVSGREQPRDRVRDERPSRPAAGTRGGGGGGGGGTRGGQEWTEVPPELEAMLRAQLTSGPARRPTEGGGTGRPVIDRLPPAEEIETFRETPEPQTAPEQAPARRGRRPAAAAEGSGDVAAAPKRTTRSRSAAATSGDESVAPKRTTTRRKAATTDESDAAEAAPAPKRRTATRRTTAAKSEADAGTESAAAEAEPAAPKRRTTRRKATEPAPDA